MALLMSLERWPDRIWMAEGYNRPKGAFYVTWVDRHSPANVKGEHVKKVENYCFSLLFHLTLTLTLSHIGNMYVKKSISRKIILKFQLPEI